MAFGVQGVGFSEPSEIIANIVIIEGDNAGLFVYNGTPSASNPPILSITDSTTDPYGNLITPSLSLSGLPELIYSGAPMLGNLIAAISGQAGTDEFGNTYIAGAQFGAPGTEQIQLIPNANTPITLTGALTGIMAGIANLDTTDADQVMGGLIGSAILGSSTTAKMCTFISSPFGTTGMGILLAAENDGSTDTAWCMIGTITTPDDTTVVFTPVMWIAPYALVLYSGSSGVTVVTKTSGSGNIAIPADAISPGRGQCWAPGGGGGTSTNFGAASAGGGEYAEEPNLAITPGGNVAFAIGAIGTGGVPSGAASTSGGNVTLTGTAVTITAHGGIKGTSTATPGAGGIGSTNTIHFKGGNGVSANTNSTQGAGGGSSAGTASIGLSGTPGGAGGTAPSGGGDGGNGGKNNQPGGAGANPGGGGAGSGAGQSGGNGGIGQARLTYSTGSPNILASISSAAITDPFGTTITSGTSIPGDVVITSGNIYPEVSSVKEVWHYVGNSGQPAFGTGWSNRGSPFVTLAFRKVASPANEVEIRGWCAVAAVADTTVFTLPTGYSPASEQSIFGWSTTGKAFEQFNIASNGIVICADANLIDAGNWYFYGIISLDQ